MGKTKPKGKGKQLSPAKAREILHDGTVHGHPITPKQQRFFGAVSSGDSMRSLNKASGRG